MSIDLNKFDFGFTAVDEHELEAVQKASHKLESTSSKADETEENKELNEKILQIRAKDFIYR